LNADEATIPVSDADSGVPETAAVAELRPVRLGAPGTGGLFPDVLGVAQKKGFIEEELAKVGYRAEFLPFQGGGPVVNEAFVAGELDVAFMGATPVVAAAASGLDIEVFSPYTNYTFYGIIVQPELDINSIDELAGHSLAVAKGTVLETFFLNFISAQGYKPEDFEIANDMSAFYSKNVDASVSMLWIAYTAEEDGIAKVIATSAENPERSNPSLAYASKAYLQENPDVPKAIIRALFRAKDFILNNKAEAYEIFAEVYDNAYSVESFEKTYSTDPNLALYTFGVTQSITDGLSALIDLMYENGQISAKPDLADFLNNSFYEAVAPEFIK
jgi:sulfonate transport system substrate-binding protein